MLLLLNKPKIQLVRKKQGIKKRQKLGSCVQTFNH